MSKFVGWMRNFEELHERARAGKLREDERAVYHAGCRRLARALIQLQRASTKPGQHPREQVRAARALLVELDLPSGRERASTRTVSGGGFSAFLGATPPQDRDVPFALQLPQGEVIQGRARVVDVKTHQNEQLTSFAFVGMPEVLANKLEIVAIDAVLGQLAKGPWPVL